MAGYHLFTILSSLTLLCFIHADIRAKHTQNRSTPLSCGFSASPITTQTTCDLSLQQVFKLLHVDNNRVLIGSTECLYVLDTNLTSMRSVPIVLGGSGRSNCEFAFPEPQKEFRCKNYITYAYGLNATSFRVCGTYSSVSPRCWTCTDNGMSVSCDNGFSTAFMPRTPTQNFTVLKAPDGAQEYYYLGGLESYTSPENILAKVQVNLNADVTDATVETDHNEEKVLKQPGNFAGSIERGGFIYYFFRERALEYENIGQIIYSRVARVCKNDIGGVTNPLSGEFTTFLKTRLICSVGADFPFIFNELQDITQSTSDPDIIYGLFTTSSAGTSSSAICRYNMAEVDALFNNDNRRGQPSSTQLWQRIPKDTEDTLARRTCSEAFPYQSYTHLEDYPLLNTNVQNCGLGQTCNDYTRQSHDAIAVFEGIRGQQLVVLDNANEPQSVYVGTNNHTIYEASISSSEVLISRQIEVQPDLQSITDTQKSNKWPLGVGYLQSHEGTIYGTLDNCAFQFNPGFVEELKILDRSPRSYHYTHSNNIEDATTHVFKLFEGPDGSNIKATFSEDLENYCSQRFFKTRGGRKREFLHVSCEIKGTLDRSITGNENIIVSSPSLSIADLPVSIVVEKDDTALVTVNMEEVNEYDKEMAKYRYRFQEWLRNVTCPDGDKQTCPAASFPTLM